MTRILIVDDEFQLRRAMGINFRERGYDIDLAESGSSALEAISKHHPDAVVLDLGLPDIDGIELIKQIREYSDVPILVLTVRDTEAAKISSLDAGADDYVTKPFSVNELLARLRAVIRRATPPDELQSVETPDFAIDFVRHLAKGSTGEDVKFTPTEWSLLEVLARNEGKLLTHKQLLKMVWGGSYGDEANYLRVYMAQIRRKLEPNPSQPKYFVTETGLGYRFILSP